MEVRAEGRRECVDGDIKLLRYTLTGAVTPMKFGILELRDVTASLVVVQDKRAGGEAAAGAAALGKAVQVERIRLTLG